VSGPSTLGSDGIPYLIDTFGFAGQIDIAALAAAPGVEGNWGKGRLTKPDPREREFPLNLNIIDFPRAATSK
jgi:hypothetical protein